jgi:hypothetical protein
MLSCPHKTRQMRRLKERVAAKAERSRLNAEEECYRQTDILVRKALNEEELEKLAKKTGFSKRTRNLTAFAFVAVMMMAGVCDTKSIKSLRECCLFLRKYFSEAIDITPQALQQRMNTKAASDFIKEVMCKILTYKTNKKFKFLSKSKSRLNTLFRVILQDSTVISLPDSLYRIFPGCGGDASKAAIKCDFIIDQTNHLVLRVKFVSGKIPDAQMSDDIINYLKKDDLIVCDLGYFKLSKFSKIGIKKAKFISRLSRSTHVYLKRDDEEPLDLIKHLDGLDCKMGADIDTDIYIGKNERLLVRLIAVKVPPEVVEARRQQFKTKRKKEPSEEFLEWNGYTLMITNISREELRLKTIIKIYKIRWQIELFFKSMKSNFCVDKLDGSNKYRILCIIYVKITMFWVISHLYAYAQALIGPEREVSLDKFTKWLNEERFREAIQMGNLSKLQAELKRDVDLLCKQKKRKRKITSDEIEISIKEECINAA